MKTEMFGPVTWSINSRSVLEKALGNWNRLFQELTALSNVEEAKATRKAVILVPFESSEDSMKAAKVALSIARHTGGQLVLCYALFPKVIPFGPANPPWVNMSLRDEALEKMKPVLEIAKEAAVTATCEIQLGTPAKVILRTARRWEADLIILTTEKRSVWSRVLFGPRTAEQVLERAECHVMVLRNV